MIKIIASICLVYTLNLPFTAASDVSGDEQIKLLLARPFVKAEFIKVRKLKIMTRPFKTSGKVLFLAEKGLVWETLKPLRNVLFISNSGVGQLDIETKELVKIENPVVKSASIVFVSIISLDLGKIKKIFKIEVLELVNGVHRYKLLPKDESIKRAIKQIEIKGKQRVEEILILENSGDSIQVLFKNEQFEQDAFTADELKLLEMM